jgi:hypothetical protein
LTIPLGVAEDTESGKLSGVLAVQLTMSRSGEVLGKKLLFTTNTALGAQVLAAITD